MLTVSLKLSEIWTVFLSLLSTGTMGAAQSAYCTGSMTFSFTNWSSFLSTKICIEYGTERTLQNLGLTDGSTKFLALNPFRIPRLSSLLCVPPENQIKFSSACGLFVANPILIFLSNHDLVDWGSSQ